MGGKLYIVYQPQKENFINGKKKYWLDIANKISSNNSIPIIDMSKEVFDVHSDPLSLLPRRTNSHVNAKANSLMSEAIKKRLIKDKIIKSN